MRWALWITTTLGIALGVYIASPLIALHGIASAVEAQDAAALSERLEFPALRRSLTKQIVAEYLKLTGKKLPIQAMARTLVVSCRSHRRPLDDRPCHFGFAWQGRCWRKGEAPDRSCSLHGVFIPKPLAALVGIRLSRKQLLRLLAAERLTRRAVQSAPQNYSLALAGGWSRTAGGSEGAIGARADQTHSGTHPSSPVISAFCTD